MAEMQFSWADIGVMSVLMSGALGVVTYIVRSEARSLKMEVYELRRRMDKMDLVLEKLADYSRELGILQERLLAQGKRQDQQDRRLDEQDRRTNNIASRVFGFGEAT